MATETLFHGNSVLITGASRGIGRSIALSFANAGAKVIAAARASEALTELSNELGQESTLWAVDATGEEILARIGDLPQLDILINNVGTNIPKPIEEMEDRAIDQMIDLNIRANYRISREAVKKMRHGSSVLMITSQMGHVGSPGRTAYCMCKHALEGLTKAMAVELAPRKIRVNSIAPTFIETELTRPMLAKPEFRQFVDQMIPLRQLGMPEDVASAALFLCSEQARMITGHSLLVDGGWTAQ